MESNLITPQTDQKPQVTAPNVQNEKSVRFRIALFGFSLFLIFVVGLFWMATTPSMTVGLTLSFVSGLSMIFLPCTLPLAFVIVPLTMGKDPKKGLIMALTFTLGLTITLSFYGIFIAAVGKAFGLKSDAEVYAVLLGGFAAFIFGLSEVGLIKFKLPSYSGKFPDFIQHQKDYMKTFFLGLLLGNVGVGCPNPAFYLLLGYIAQTGDIFNGWFLGFVHGMGRSVPLIFLAILGTLGVNALSGLARHKEAIGKIMGWMLLIIGAFLLTFGIFGHDWFIASGVHGGWEQFIVNVTGDRFGETVLKHEHKLVNIPNFLQYGNMFFLGLLALTISAAFIFRRPSRRTIISLIVTYSIIALAIGHTTEWTFKLSPHFNMQHGAPHGMSKEDMPAAVPGDHEAGHGAAQYHEETAVQQGLAVNLNVMPIPVLVGTSTRLDFFVNTKPGNIPVPVDTLEIKNTKRMHVIGVRDDMEEFFHIHPEPIPMQEYDPISASMLSVPYIFKNPGRYKIWSEITKEGVTHITGHSEITVEGQGQASNKHVVFGTSYIVDGYQALMHYADPIVKNQPTDITFEIHDSLGRDVNLADYLGVKIHLTVIKDDWKQFIHTHPSESSGNDDAMMHTGSFVPLINEANAHGDDGEETADPAHDNAMTSIHTIPFNVTFPEAGVYRVFAQFQPANAGLSSDEALTASFWVQIAEKSPTPAIFKNWWLNLFAALVLMTLLSFGVKAYLRPGA